jgi:glucose-6-phosphate isomerase
MEGKIELSAEFCISENVQGGGLDREEIEKWTKEGLEALKSINKRRWELGFTQLPFQDETIELIRSLDICEREWENVVLVGIGGSSLGTSALFKALKPINYNLFPYEARKGPKLFVLDNPDPELCWSVLQNIKKEKTIFLIISKSGETIESVAYFYIILDILKDLQRNILIITTLNKGFLWQKAENLKIKLLPFPENVAGRYSVLSIVGLLPLYLLKVDISSLLKGARSIAEFLHQRLEKENPSVLSASLLVGLFERGKKIQVIMPYASSLYEMTLWYCQLWAESLGKKVFNFSWGQTPFPALGAVDQHSQLQLWVDGPKDKVVSFWEVQKFRKDLKVPELGFSEFYYLEGKNLSQLLRTEKKATEKSLAMNGVPSMTYLIPEINPFFMGQLIYLLELQTVIAGEIIGVNPFDQPGVELGKKLTKEYMG